MARYIHELIDQAHVEVERMSDDEAELFDDLWPEEDCR